MATSRAERLAPQVSLQPMRRGACFFCRGRIARIFADRGTPARFPPFGPRDTGQFYAPCQWRRWSVGIPLLRLVDVLSGPEFRVPAHTATRRRRGWSAAPPPARGFLFG